jgi:predicted ester cyclase
MPEDSDRGRTPEEELNVAAAEAQVRAYNSKEEGWFDRFFAEEVDYHTYGPWTPQGLSTDRKHLKEMAMGAMQFFPDRTMKVEGMVAEGDTIALETVWFGTAADGHPSLQPGERLVLRNILFNRYRDGKIVETREYGVRISE